MNETEVINYLRPSSTGLWKWGDDGKVLLWSDGRTVAFLPELHAAVDRLAATGLPPMGGLALALAAMRGAWSQDASQRNDLVRYVKAALSPTGEMDGLITGLLKDATTRLDALAALPEDLCKGPEARSLLVEMLFENVPPLHKPPGINQLLFLLSQRIPEFDKPDISLASEHAAEALTILKSLAASRLLTDIEAIRTRQRVGIEHLPKAPELHISEIVRGLLGTLRGDPELAGLAKLAASILAVLSIPRRLMPETELPLGGFSDIANRGTLDRLLISELAHDDTTLAVRVALNEALYLRRESPRKPTPFTRLLVIDSGIRSWGIPHLFSTAVALAFAVNTPKGASLQVFRAQGKDLTPVDLRSREGLLAHLEQLDPAPHPGAAFSTLAATLHELGETNPEAILVTHPDTDADPDFHRELQMSDLYPIMLATVAATGHFALKSLSAVGQKPITQALLSLKEILPAKPGQPALTSPGEELPALFRLIVSPFRLPLPTTLNQFAASDRHGLVGVIGRKLTHWPIDGRCRELFTLPSATGTILGLITFDEPATAAIALFDPVDKHLHLATISLSNHQKTVHQRIPGIERPPTIASHNNTLLLLYPEKAEAYNLDRVVRIGSIILPRTFRPLGSRYFEASDGKIYSLVFDGAGLHLLDVPLPSAPLTVFSRIGFEGPAALFADGSIRDSLGNTLAPPSVWATSIQRKAHSISDDGHRLVVAIQTPQGNKNFGMDLRQKTPEWLPMGNRDPKRFLLGPHADLSNNPSVPRRRKFQGLCVFNGDLTLVSHRQKRWSLQAAHGKFAFTGRHSQGNLYRPFQPDSNTAAALHGLLTASWADGSRAWLDPRGILHLRSSDPHLPEISILLYDANPTITAWTSDNTTFGSDFLLEEQPTGRLDELRIHLQNFVARLK